MDNISTNEPLCEMLALICQLRNETSKEIPSQLKNLVIHIQGDQLSGSIDAQIAGAIVQLQQSVYRLAAKTIYGKDATINTLREDELEIFKLNFVISAGSTNIVTEIWDKAENLIKIFTKDMTPSQKLCLAGICAALLLGYVGIKEYADYSKEALRLAAQTNMSKEESRRLELFLSHTQEVSEENSLAFAKAAKGASSLSYGGKTFSKDDIAEAQKRAPKIYMDWQKVTENYIVTGIDCTREDILIATLVNPSTNEVIKSTYTSESNEDEIALEIRTVLAISLASGRPIKLELNIGRKGDHIEKSTILNVIE